MAWGILSGVLSDQLKGVEQLWLRPLSRLESQLASLVEHRLWLEVLVGTVLGLGVSLALGPAAEGRSVHHGRRSNSGHESHGEQRRRRSCCEHGYELLGWHSGTAGGKHS